MPTDPGQPDPPPPPPTEPDPPPEMGTLQQTQMRLQAIRAVLPMTDPRRATLEAAMDIVADFPDVTPITH